MAPVQLYVYDLSRGMAAQMSRQLTGQYVEGIWHSSIVFYGKEFFYGAGIQYCLPGKSHLGSPLKVHELGDSGVDEETFTEYINEMRSVYTPDKYHLLDFNCNSFTNDCAGFLTGGSIPAYIKDLPRDFMNTPFGASLRPTIDQMFGRSAQTVQATPPVNGGGLTSGILQGVAANATAPSPSSPFANGIGSPSSTLTAPVQICTNLASFNTILGRHKATVAFFTSQTCPPCRMIEPTFESLAQAKASPKVAFVKVDLGVGMGHQVAQVHNIHATPTFLFFLNEKKTHELKGANAPELRSQIDFLIYDAFPPHPHSKLGLKALRDVSLNPILFAQVPKLDAVSTKLTSSIEASQTSQSEQKSIKQTILQEMIPTLQSRLGPNKAPGRVTGDQVKAWVQSTELLLGQVPSPQLFPLVDLWRLAVLIPEIPAILVSDGLHVITSMLASATNSISSPEGKNLTITGIRLACNLFANSALARRVLSTSPLKDGTVPRSVVMGLLVQALLAEPQNIRVAAASIAFNASALWQKPLMECFHRGMTGQMTCDEVLDDVDWQVEMVSAVVEAIGREDNEDSLHRLVICLGFLVHLSPHLDDIRPLLEVLQTKQTLRSKLQTVKLVQKKSVRDLIEEVGEQLC